VQWLDVQVENSLSQHLKHTYLHAQLDAQKMFNTAEDDFFLSIPCFVSMIGAGNSPEVMAEGISGHSPRAVSSGAISHRRRVALFFVKSFKVKGRCLLPKRVCCLTRLALPPPVCARHADVTSFTPHSE